MTPETRVKQLPNVDPDLRPEWIEIGKSGDMTDILLAILSHASVAGLSKFREYKLYESFAQLEEEFPHLIPKLLVQRKILRWQGKRVPHFTSDRLGRAIGAAFCLGLEVTTDFRVFEIRQEGAPKILERRTPVILLTVSVASCNICIPSGVIGEALLKRENCAKALVASLPNISVNLSSSKHAWLVNLLSLSLKRTQN